MAWGRYPIPRGSVLLVRSPFGSTQQPCKVLHVLRTGMLWTVAFPQMTLCAHSGCILGFRQHNREMTQPPDFAWLSCRMLKYGPEGDHILAYCLQDFGQLQTTFNMPVKFSLLAFVFGVSIFHYWEKVTWAHFPTFFIILNV